MQNSRFANDFMFCGVVRLKCIMIACTTAHANAPYYARNKISDNLKSLSNSFASIYVFPPPEINQDFPKYNINLITCILFYFKYLYDEIVVTQLLNCPVIIIK